MKNLKYLPIIATLALSGCDTPTRTYCQRYSVNPDHRVAAEIDKEPLASGASCW